MLFPFFRSPVKYFMQQHGGSGGECPNFLRSEWLTSVSNERTQSGYWSWAYARSKEQGHLRRLYGYLMVEGHDKESVSCEPQRFRNLEDAKAKYKKKASYLFETVGLSSSLLLYKEIPNDPANANCKPDFVLGGGHRENGDDLQFQVRNRVGDPQAGSFGYASTDPLGGI